jgi:hypothetical protein
MSNKRNLWTPLVAVLIALTASVTQAQSPEPAGGNGWHSPHKNAIVGTWMGTLGNGTRTLITFNADETVSNSSQGEISANTARLTHTNHHGVWRYLGGRQFGVTLWDIIYDVNTGQLLQYTRIRLEVTVGENGDDATARSRVEFFDPQGNVVLSRSGSATYVRIPYEPIE